MNYRIFVEKKENFRVEAQNLYNELKENLSIENLENLRILKIYDIFNLNEDDLKKVVTSVFSEENTDRVYYSIEDVLNSAKNIGNIDVIDNNNGININVNNTDNASNRNNILYFATEFLPGQYDQRADSAVQCINLISDSKDITVNSGKLIILYGNISEEELKKIKKYYINEVEMREKNLMVLNKNSEKENKEKVFIYNNFTDKSEKEIENFKNELELAMTVKDLQLIQKYFRDEEKRNPTETEIRVLDTYWSDHCRHTTFETVIDNIEIEKGKYKDIIEKTLNEYIKSREYVHEKKIDKKPMTLMDLATIFGKEARKKGLLSDLEVSDEINACSIYIDVPVNEKTEKWILQFKNETHNHPTEIEPFGGASTCIGGAIRDPLSGRTFVYQAVRISGSGDTREKLENTIKGKLPQKIITQKAAHGFSSYGNQIGLATTYVNEIYDEGYKAKRMELGLVVGAAPAKNIIREKPDKNDVVVLLGGRTGRDGIGGATGSSKEHTRESSEKCGAEVQKGNAITERKIQRLFRNGDVTKLIKKCNDFGAGGVSVAIGELADGLEIDLNKVKVKYTGLTGTELAISESQERMAVVIQRENLEKFIKYAEEENLEAYKVAEVTDKNRLVMKYNDEIIVDISRDFLNTNGAKANINIEIENSKKLELAKEVSGDTLKEQFINNMKELNVCSQRGLAETFDSSIGSTTVLAMYGGKYQLTPSEVSAQKISVANGETDTVSIVSYGYNPFIAKQSTFHGGAFAVIESMCKIVAAGGNYKNIRFTFQEYFERLGNNPKKWGKPLSALLGTLHIQKEFGLPSIGGKDSMSGTFHDISVPPTLVSFAVSITDAENVISSEFKKEGNNIYLVNTKYNENDLPDLKCLKENFDFITENIKNKKIISASAVKGGGISETLAKMCFGNKKGIDINLKKINSENLFKINYGAFILETEENLEYKNAVLIGKVSGDKNIVLNNDNENIEINLEELISEWEEPLKKVFPTKVENENKTADISQPNSDNSAMYFENSDKINKTSNNVLNDGKNYSKFQNKDYSTHISSAYINNNEKFGKPRIFIPVFPGTNCEYDLERIFNKEGGTAEIGVFNNLSYEKILGSIDDFVKRINNTQILMFPGGFSSGDEPDGSAKFIVAVLKNKKIMEAVHKFLERDGLILGICNGFQALIKSGLLPYGEIRELDDNSPTLTYNSINKHMAKMVRTKIITDNSPWLAGMEVGEIHTLPMSHGEGRVVITEEEYKKLYANNQIATKYVDFEGNPSMETEFNPNGSYYAIEGMLAYNGRIFGKMAHSERMGKNLYKNIYGNKEQNIFRNGIKFFL